MLIFMPVISCLTTSNLPWLMDLTSQVPMEYCFLWNRTLLPSSITSTTGCSSLIWLYLFILSGVISPLISAGNQHERSHPWQGHAEEIWQARQIRTPGTPWTCLSIYPKPKSVCLLYTILCLSPTVLTLTGGYPWSPFSGENQLRALADKSPGHERSISIQPPLLAF